MILKKIDGYKSIIGIITLALIHLAEQQGWVTPGMATLAYEVVGTWTGVSIMLKINKIVK